MDLQRREQLLQSENKRLNDSHSTLKTQQDDLRRQEVHLRENQSQSSFWSAYSKIDELLQQKQVPSLKESSITVLQRLLDNPRKDKDKLLDLLAEDHFETNLRTIQNSGNSDARLEYGKALDKLKKEKEKRDKKRR